MQTYKNLPQTQGAVFRAIHLPLRQRSEGREKLRGKPAPDFVFCCSSIISEDGACSATTWPWPLLPSLASLHRHPPPPPRRRRRSTKQSLRAVQCLPRWQRLLPPTQLKRQRREAGAARVPLDQLLLGARCCWNRAPLPSQTAASR